MTLSYSLIAAIFGELAIMLLVASVILFIKVRSSKRQLNENSDRIEELKSLLSQSEQSADTLREDLKNKETELGNAMLELEDTRSLLAQAQANFDSIGEEETDSDENHEEIDIDALEDKDENEDEYASAMEDILGEGMPDLGENYGESLEEGFGGDDDGDILGDDDESQLLDDDDLDINALLSEEDREEPDNQGPSARKQQNEQVSFDVNLKKTYNEFLVDAIDKIKRQLKERFKVDPSSAIDLIDKDISMEQFIGQLHYDFLLAEKAGAREGYVDSYWHDFADNMQGFARRIFGMPEQKAQGGGSGGGKSADPTADIEGAPLSETERELVAQQQKVKSLAIYKKMFFDLQNRIRETVSGARDTNDQMLELAQALGAMPIAEFANMQAEYISKLEEMVGKVTPETTPLTAEDIGSAPSASTRVSTAPIEDESLLELPDLETDQAVLNLAMDNAGDQLNKLQSSNQQQQNIINDLLEEHEANDGSAEQAEKIKMLEASAKESDMCIQTLETELDSAHDEIGKLNETVNKLAKRLKTALSQNTANLSRENHELQNAIKTLEDSHEDLQDTINALESKLMMSESRVSKDKDLIHNLEAQIKQFEMMINMEGDQAGRDDELERLSEELNQRDDQFWELERKYADLEIEFLALKQAAPEES